MVAQPRLSTETLRAVVIFHHTRLPQNQVWRNNVGPRHHRAVKYMIEEVHPKLTAHQCRPVSAPPTSANSTAAGTAPTPSVRATGCSSFRDLVTTDIAADPLPTCATVLDCIELNVDKYQTEANLWELATVRPEIARLQEMLDCYEAEEDANRQHIIFGIYGPRGLGTNMVGIKKFFERYTKITITLAVLKPCDGHVPKSHMRINMHKLLRAMDEPLQGRPSKFLWDLMMHVRKKRNLDAAIFAEARAKEQITGILTVSTPFKLRKYEQKNEVLTWWRVWYAMETLGEQQNEEECMLRQM